MARRTIADELELISHDMDTLIGKLRTGGRRPPSHDDIDEEVLDLAARLIIVMRGHCQLAAAIGRPI